MDLILRKRFLKRYRFILHEQPAKTCLGSLSFDRQQSRATEPCTAMN